MKIDRNHLKTDTDIAQWFGQNKAFEEQMDRAIRLVASDDHARDFDQAKRACIKAFDAIVDGIKVFFSFVGNDSRFAFAFLDSLNNADTSNRLCRKPPFPYMFHRSESRAIGDVYSQQILAALRRNRKRHKATRRRTAIRPLARCQAKRRRSIVNASYRY